MSNIITLFQQTLFNRLRSKTPIDTGNMLANIVYGQLSSSEVSVTVSAPMSSRNGRTSRATGKVIESKNSNYDYSKAVNYGAKSPHRFWVEHQIKETAHIIRSNANFGFYK